MLEISSVSEELLACDTAHCSADFAEFHSYNLREFKRHEDGEYKYVNCFHIKFVTTQMIFSIVPFYGEATRK
jgi:hypothetical protein